MSLLKYQEKCFSVVCLFRLVFFFSRARLIRAYDSSRDKQNRRPNVIIPCTLCAIHILFPVSFSLKAIFALCVLGCLLMHFIWMCSFFRSLSFRSRKSVCNHHNVILSICLLFYDESSMEIKNWTEQQNKNKTAKDEGRNKTVFGIKHYILTLQSLSESLYSQQNHVRWTKRVINLQKKIFFGLHLCVSNGK